MAMLAVGDSITGGFSRVETRGVPSQSWASWVASVAREELTTYALPGGTSHAIRSKFVGRPLDDYSLALIYVGVNNVTSWKNLLAFDLADDLRAILSWVAPHAARLAIMTYPSTLGRTWSVLPYGPRLRYRVDYANDIVRKVGAEFGAVVIDAPDLRVPKSVIGDGIHPNSVGHRAMAEAALSALGMPSTSRVETADLPALTGYHGLPVQTAVTAALRPPRALVSWARCGFKWSMP